jgi:hypothetical protein
MIWYILGYLFVSFLFAILVGTIIRWGTGDDEKNE